MRYLVLLILALSACVESAPEGRGTLGSPDDVATKPGDHATFRLLTECMASDFGVVGTGSVKLATVEEIASAGSDLHEQLKAIPSLWGWGGARLACKSGVGTGIDLDDWRDVDAVIATTAAFLHERDLALEVTISVDSVPVAVAQ
jgi:hypothetical protein